MDKTFDVITVGNATIDAIISVQDTNPHLCINEKSHELCAKYGQKIPVEGYKFCLGGNACNIAVGMSRMGYKSSLCAEIGDDEFAQKIKNGLIKENIDQALLLQTKGAATTFAVAINFKNERTIFVEHVKRKHNFSFDEVLAKWVYLTSIGRDWKNAYQKTLDFVKSNNIKLAFSPGTHQLEEGYEGIANVLEAADILFVNREEAIRISNIKYPAKGEARQRRQISNTNEEIKKLLETLQKLGPKVVVVTDGKDGSYVLDDSGKFYHLGFFPASVVQKTGAGDAYASGFLSAIMLDKSIVESMRWGAVNAASVIEHIGAQEGLLGKEEIEKKLDEHLEFQVEELGV